jgi:hypothetical protein
MLLVWMQPMKDSLENCDEIDLLCDAQKTLPCISLGFSYVAMCPDCTNTLLLHKMFTFIIMVD